jgi:hypothetical protein
MARKTIVRINATLVLVYLFMLLLLVVTYFFAKSHDAYRNISLEGNWSFKAYAAVLAGHTTFYSLAWIYANNVLRVYRRYPSFFFLNQTQCLHS